ncbi:hypothetical protein [Nostoc sp. TCL26-01]|uniref:hypothetical protein n=1 Tax=Nostoc sp. TCL26-01 TaxID=2576904 RepID=UPI0015BF47F5|nr:hypothetical protein [Nostoc sp. TCL26-01]QLE60025.1 hypothetical protein FD725_31960 [Nostoc sp. TCL26-01]
MVASALPSQTQTKKQFLQSTPEELKRDYKAKVLNAEAYVYYIIKAKRAAGWQWRFNIKYFCAEWEIPKRTFYWVLSKLKDKKLIDWCSDGSTIVVCWGGEITEKANIHSSDSLKTQKPNTVEPVQHLAQPLQDVAQSLQDVAQPLQDVAQENAKTLSQTASCNASYIEQIYSNIHTDSAPASATQLPIQESVCVENKLKFEEQPQEVITQSQLPVEKSKEDISSLIKNPNLDPNSAASLNKISKKSEKQGWVCPGTEEEKREFLEFKASLLVRDKRCGQIESLSYALAWANRHLEEASLLFEQWHKDKQRKANDYTSPSMSLEVVPEFRRMPETEHMALLKKFIDLSRDEFIKLCSWYQHWIEFALTPLGKKRIPNLNTEIIQQMREVLRCQTV